MSSVPSIILASGSARRKELLTQIGVSYSVLVTDIDESRYGDEPPLEYVQRLALEKAAAGRQLSDSNRPVLGADTVVLLDDLILGKPVDRAQAADMLRMISGRDHLVLSAVAMNLATGEPQVVVNSTGVTFAEMPEDFIQRYCSSDEPLDKAGAYAIQGEPGIYVSRIEGSYSGVMGLPLYETGRLLASAGVIS
jgi:septum formation protein